MHVGIRKLAHVVEFAAFSVTVFRGVRAGRSGWRWSWALTTLVVAVAYASLDEWHQSFVPLRQATPGHERLMPFVEAGISDRDD